ncbi:MAG: TOBE domain-containing protein [Candidatus Binatia bacterium]
MAVHPINDAPYFESGDLRIEIADGPMPRTITIHPEAIIILRAPLHSSARNCFTGQVGKVERDGASIVVTVDCGQPLIARITRHSYEEIGLNVGVSVQLTFKSSAIHILG